MDKLNTIFEKAKPLTDKIKASPAYADPTKRKVIAILLAVALVFVSVFGVIGLVTKGESINAKKEAAKYNENVGDSSSLYKAATREELHPLIDDLDALVAAQLNSMSFESFVYSDEVASLVGMLLGTAAEKDFASVKFNALEKDYPEAYNYVSSLQSSGKDWKNLKTVPFGITKGDKEAFIDACGAFGEFLGNDMISIFLKAPSIYNDALVPALESLHTGEMPSLAGFVMKTGLSGKARVKLLVEKVLTIIEPIKEAPVTYLCEMLPDFAVNYTRACEFINSRDLGLKLPEVEAILDLVFDYLGMTHKSFDLEYVSTLGTAKVAKSGGNGGKRVEITGDRDAVLLYIADYVFEHLTYENNYPAVEKLLTQTLKEIDRNGEIGKILYSDNMNKIAACFIEIVALNTAKATENDAQTVVNQHNAAGTDNEAVFAGFMSRETVSKLIGTLDSTLSAFLRDNNVEAMIFTDTVASVFVKLSAEFCSIDFADVPFDSMSYSFPEAYNYLMTLQSEGKTWSDVGTIPFGITAGDKDAFIKACGAGGEYLGDILALNMLIAPSIYDEALVTLTESLHTGVSPDVREFIDMHGIDGAKRIEIVLELALTMLEPLKEAPVSYLCTILPDLIYGYEIAAACGTANPNLKQTGLEILPLNDLFKKLLGEMGILVPDYDFGQIVALSTAQIAPSGDRTGIRAEFTGDKEAVFAALASYVKNILGQENNVQAIANAANQIFGINAGLVQSLLSTFKLILGA